MVTWTKRVSIKDNNKITRLSLLCIKARDNSLYKIHSHCTQNNYRKDDLTKLKINSF
jgi:hypothetical protein